MKNLSKLVKKKITRADGVQTTVYVKQGEEPKAQKEVKPDEQRSGKGNKKTDSSPAGSRATKLVNFAKKSPNSKLKEALNHKNEAVRSVAKNELDRRKTQRKTVKKDKRKKTAKNTMDKLVNSKAGKWSSRQADFYKSGELESGSKTRKSIGTVIKNKAKGIVRGLKHEVAEWKEAGGALIKMTKGQSLSKHEKKALKAVAIHTALVVGSMTPASLGLVAAKGALASFLPLLKGFAVHFVEHAVLVRVGHSAIFAKADTGNKETQALENFISQMGEYIASAKMNINDIEKIGDMGQEDYNLLDGEEEEEAEEGEGDIEKAILDSENKLFWLRTKLD